MDVEFRGKDKMAIAIADALRPLGMQGARDYPYRNNNAMVDAMRHRVSDAGRKLADHPVFDALEKTDRALFIGNVESPYRFRSFQAMDGKDFVVPSPHMVAGNLIFLDPGEGSRVLEIGTGSGYTAAVLSAMGASCIDCYETDPEINEYAESKIKELCGNIPPKMNLFVGDGFRPMEDGYDRIHASIFPVTPYQTEVLSRLSDEGIAVICQATPEGGICGPLDVLEEDKWVKIKTDDGRELYSGMLFIVSREEGNLVYRIARETGAAQPAKTL